MHQTKRRYWPIALFLLACIGLDAIALPAMSSITMRWPGFPIQTFSLCLMGFLAGQGCVAVLISGLWNRHWIYGLCLGTMLAWLGTAVLLAGQFLFENRSFVLGVDWSAFWALANIPLILVGSAIPLFVLRYFWGMHLTRANENPVRTGRGIPDFLIATAMVGTTLFLCRVPQVAWELRPWTYWPIIGSLFMAMGLFSVLVVLPLTMVTFQIKNRWIRWALYCVFIFSGGVLTGLMETSFVQPGGSPYAAAFGFGVFPSLLFILGTSTLKLSGYRLARFESVSSSEVATNDEDSAESDPFAQTELAEPDSEVAAAPDSRPKATQESAGPKLTVAFLFLLAVAGSFAIQWIESGRARADKSHRVLAAQLSSVGGEIRTQNHQVVQLILPTETTDEDLAEHTDLSNLVSLILKDSQITDGASEQLAVFQKLREIDLSGTAITAKTLDAIQDLEIESLKIAGTQLSVEEVFGFLQSRPETLQELDISDMDWSFEDLMKLSGVLPNRLGLRGYGFDDVQLKELIQAANFDYGILELDVSENQLTGDFLAGLTNIKPSVAKLVLDKNPLKDSAVSTCISKSNCRIERISFAETPLTDLVLPGLQAVYIGEIEFGDGKITEAGLKTFLKKHTFPPRYIALNSKQFDASCLKSWTNTSLFRLDLSGSSVTDETLQDIKLMMPYLNLSDTEISDNSLPYLGGSSFQGVVNLSNTKVTADGLCQGDLSEYEAVYVDFGQFSEKELSKISKVINIQVGLPEETERIRF